MLVRQTTLSSHVASPVDYGFLNILRWRKTLSSVSLLRKHTQICSCMETLNVRTLGPEFSATVYPKPCRSLHQAGCLSLEFATFLS